MIYVPYHSLTKIHIVINICSTIINGFSTGYIPIYDKTNHEFAIIKKKIFITGQNLEDNCL